MADTVSINGRGQIIRPANIFIYPKGEDLQVDDLRAFILHNKSIANEYHQNEQMYLGNHDILHSPDKRIGFNNRLVANLPHYIVETYNGYFAGVEPKFTLDDDVNNGLLQDWNNTNSFADKLNEISRTVDIVGRALAFVYQDEDSNTRVAFADPDGAFVVYDDTVARDILAFVRYWDDAEGRQHAVIYYANHVQTMVDGAFVDDQINPYGYVPAVEFYSNEDRQGVFDNVKTLINALDKVLSQKANQTEYFDNAYLKVLGLNLDADNDGKPDVDIASNQMIYSPDADATSATVDFISKPDGDGMQENLITRLISMIYQISMVANLNDEAFAGNSSGVALQYKLLPMSNMAATKERKFTQALRKLYRIVFSAGTVLNQQSADAWKDLKFQFTRNLPINYADEADTASKLTGITSKETQLSILSFVDDPKKELARIAEENSNQVKQAVTNQASALDLVKDDNSNSQGDVADEQDAEAPEDKQ